MRAVAFVLAWLCGATSWGAQELVSVTPRGDAAGGPVVVPYLLETPRDRTPSAVLLVLPQGNGRLGLGGRTLPVKHPERSLVFMRAAGRFSAAGLAIALLDAPSDQPTGFDVRHRESESHRTDIAAAVRDLRTRLPGVRIYLAATGVGAISVLHAGRDLGGTIAGVVIAGGSYGELRTFDYGALRVPVLMLHNVDDECSSAPVIEAIQAASRFPIALVTLSGGADGQARDPCYSATRHGLWGLEREVVAAVSEWVEDRVPASPIAHADARAVFNERVVYVPAPHAEHGVRLETTIFLPDGEGPFPVVIFNHGIPSDKADVERRRIRYRYLSQTREFIDRGFAVVIPMRRGYGFSGGQFNPSSCDLERFGMEDAKDIRAVADYVSGQPWADPDALVVIGQSGGGLASLAFAATGYPGVRGIVNFAGGLRLMGNLSSEMCWRPGLARAYAAYGARTKVASLWLYAENDSYFGPGVARELHEAYVRAGGKARLPAIGPFKTDGHFLFGDLDGNALWLGPVDRFLAEIGFGPNVLDAGPAE